MFTTRDPLGRDVNLQAKTWNVHITPYHKELYRQEALVRRAIENPKYILQDIYDMYRNNYYELCHFPQYGHLSVLKIVVDFTASTGDVVTAYPIINTQAQAITRKGVVYERP